MGAAEEIETDDAVERASRFELRRIDSPHPDIELGVARSGLDYLVCAPDRGVNADTGLVLFFVGYGMEQGADGGGRDHRAGQPTVKRHHAVLGEPEDAAGVERGDQAVMDVGRDDPGADVV